jgi:hypothetical protein
MHYMMLMYSKETPGGPSEETAAASREGNWKVMEEATAKGVLIGVGPLASTASATTVRMENGKALVTDGPFAETKEHLAGFYIIDCENLEEAIGWASKIPTSCKGGPGCIEIRPMPALPKKSEAAHEGELLSASQD